MAQVNIEKLVFGGQGMGRLNGKIVFVWNALPGETVEIDIIQNKKTHIEAVAKNIVIPAKDRVDPQEGHFLSCSPWQILSDEKELWWKKELAQETYEKIGGLSPRTLELVPSDKTIGYRNKMEYSFAELEDGTISLAFFDRGQKHRSSIPDCILADPCMTAATKHLLSWINQNRIPIRSLKTLIIRSNRRGEIIVGLFLKDRLVFPEYPTLEHGLIGVTLFYSTHKSPASVPTAILYTEGKQELTETILETTLSYGLFSFFQIHVPIFEQALQDISKHLNEPSDLLDYYAGVGSIGIPLQVKTARGMLVENNAEAVSYAQKNIAQNELNGRYEAMTARAERMTNLIDQKHTVIVDPPRAGLDERMTKAILTARPKRIIYLSCNLSTHARDLSLLLPMYHLSFLKLYNFFPRTPHIEGLAILDRI